MTFYAACAIMKEVPGKTRIIKSYLEKNMDYSAYNTDDKQQRIRVVLIATAIAVIVLGIASWAIIAIVGSRNQAAVQETETVAVDDTVKTEEPTPTAAPVTEGVSKTTAPAKQTTTTQTQVQNAVPETGPEELLPLALVAGLGTAFVASRKLAKNSVIA